MDMMKCLVEECGADTQQKGIWKGDYKRQEFTQVTPMWVATYENQLDVVKYLASKGSRTEATDSTERRLELHIAAGNGNLDLVKCLVEECAANIHEQNRCIWRDRYSSQKFTQVTPLWVAIYKNELDVVKYLVSKKQQTALKGHLNCM